jgi:hypothetical protein
MGPDHFQFKATWRVPGSRGRACACAVLVALQVVFATAVALWTAINIGPN